MAAMAALLAVIAAAQIELVAHRDGMFYADRDVPVGADFLAFYAAGRIVAAGDGHNLYQPERQAKEQREILGRDRGLAAFPYPAFVALPYAMLAKLSLPWAYALTTLVMIAATVSAVLLLRNVSPTVRDQPALVTLLVLASQPFNAALLGGQTVALTFLCFAGLYSGLRREHPFQAGAWLGLLLYKPQMAAVVLLLLVYRCRWRPLAAAGLTAAVLMLLGAAVAGIEWPRSFWQMAAGDFYRINVLVADGVRNISLPGVVAHLAGEGTAWNAAVALLCLGIAMLLLGVWRDCDPAGNRFSLQFAAAVVGTLLISPHALFYEAGLLILPLIALIDRWNETGKRPLLLLAGLFGFGELWPLAETVGFEPLALLPALIGALVLLELHRTRNGVDGRQPLAVKAA
jgi:alpha-1,2-mannosyltransferase